MQRNQTQKCTAAVTPIYPPGGPRAPLAFCPPITDPPINAKLDEALNCLWDTQAAVAAIRYTLIGVEAPTSSSCPAESVEGKAVSLSTGLASLLGDIRTIAVAIG